MGLAALACVEVCGSVGSVQRQVFLWQLPGRREEERMTFWQRREAGWGGRSLLQNTELASPNTTEEDEGRRKAARDLHWVRESCPAVLEDETRALLSSKGEKMAPSD